MPMKAQRFSLIQAWLLFLVPVWMSIIQYCGMMPKCRRHVQGCAAARHRILLHEDEEKAVSMSSR